MLLKLICFFFLVIFIRELNILFFSVSYMWYFSLELNGIFKSKLHVSIPVPAPVPHSPWVCGSWQIAHNALYFVLQHSPVQVVGEGGVGELQSYTSACTLLESGLAETLIFNLDWRGSLVAVNLAVRTEEAPYKVNLIIIYLILLPLSSLLKKWKVVWSI